MRWCKSVGARCKKLRIENERGFPDRTVLLPNGVAVFVELKRRGEKPSPLQKQWLTWLAAHGYACGWADNFEDAQAIVERYL